MHHCCWASCRRVCGKRKKAWCGGTTFVSRCIPVSASCSPPRPGPSHAFPPSPFPLVETRSLNTQMMNQLPAFVVVGSEGPKAESVTRTTCVAPNHRYLRINFSHHFLWRIAFRHSLHIRTFFGRFSHRPEPCVSRVRHFAASPGLCSLGVRNQKQPPHHWS